MTRRHSSAAARGYDATHRRARAQLLAHHVDGTPCPCLTLGDCGTRCPCRRTGHGLPMYTDAWRNVDGRPLQADHGQPLALGGPGQPDRLMLATCNLSRGAALGNRIRGARRHGHGMRMRVAAPRW